MNTQSLKFLLAAGAAVCAGIVPATAANGIKVEHLGVNNTLVRVNPDSVRWLIMPVQESCDDARVNVLADGKLERTIFVRLSKNHTDYTVPFDLTPYRGKKVVLDIVTPQSRSSVREAANDACWQDMALSDSYSTANREKYRPAFHHTPLYGWMNDPNGMVYKDGVWTLCYQWNPYGSKWQNMTWGRSTSKDLVNWEHHGPAIVPDGLGTIFSGSCAIDRENSAGFGKDAIVAMYTSAATSQTQSLAHSTDGGNTFHKYAGNPVITLDSEFRDPNMFWYAPAKEWVLVLAHALEHEMLVYTSKDMKNWTLQSRFGKGLGAQDGVWECPDLFELPAGKGSKWVMLVNLNPGGPFGGSATQYFVGDFDGKTFTPDRDKNGNVPTKWMDYGKDHYATVSFSDTPDGRRTVLGWMSNWQYANDVPTQQYRSANTLPRDLSLFRGKDGSWYLASAPSPEVDALRASTTARVNSSLSTTPVVYTLPADNDGICEIDATITAAKGPVTMTLSNDKGEKTLITYDPAKATVSVDRTASGVTDFSRDFSAVTTAPLPAKVKALSLRIFVDRSSIEVFANDGQAVLTNLVFPSAPYSTLSVSADPKATLKALSVYPLKPTVK